MLGIFGAGRNGSTRLMRLFDASPDLWIYPIELRWLKVRTAVGDDPRGARRAGRDPGGR